MKKRAKQLEPGYNEEDKKVEEEYDPDYNNNKANEKEDDFADAEDVDKELWLDKKAMDYKFIKGKFNYFR